jgi:hypothetical protein
LSPLRGDWLISILDSAIITAISLAHAWWDCASLVPPYFSPLHIAAHRSILAALACITHVTLFDKE